MRNVAHFFFSYNGIFGIEEVILQNIWQNTQEKIRNIKREREKSQTVMEKSMRNKVKR